MASIITDKLRKQVADALLTEITNATDANQYYIGIGKSDQYDDSDNVVTPIRSLREERLARSNLQSIKQVSSQGVSFVIPRYNWTSGSVYSGFNDNAAGLPTNTYYVLTETNEVYLCLQQGKNVLGVPSVSTVQPNYNTAGVSAIQAFQTADGYRWKFMYAISAIRASNFLSANYVPVQKIADSSGAPTLTPLEVQQAQIQEAAVPGQILGVNITNGGTGYTSAPTVTFRGNGSNAAATATISGGVVVKVEMNNESAGLGSGYDYASVVFSGGSPTTAATGRAIIGPLAGLGADVRDDLKATSLMITAKPNGDEGGTFLIDNQDFRQIVLFKNIQYKDSDGVFTGLTGKALRSFQIDSSSTLTVDNLISGDSASAYIDQISGTTLFYHQNENTGFGTFANEPVTDDGGGTASILNALDSAGRGAEVDAFSGDVLYIENRAPIIRSSIQSEDIKIVLTF